MNGDNTTSTLARDDMSETSLKFEVQTRLTENFCKCRLMASFTMEASNVEGVVTSSLSSSSEEELKNGEQNRISEKVSVNELSSVSSSCTHYAGTLLEAGSREFSLALTLPEGIKSGTGGERVARMWSGKVSHFLWKISLTGSRALVSSSLTGQREKSW